MRRGRVWLMMSGLLAARVALGGDVVISPPSNDVWQYPFNFDPCCRTTAPLFSSIGSVTYSTFNDRDGVLIAAWDTGGVIEPGHASQDYGLLAVRVTFTSIAGADWPVDLTPDEWFTFDFGNDGVLNGDGYPRGDPRDRDGESDDLDAGRPLELFGAGFGPGYSLGTWNESSLYHGADEFVNRPRDPFPFVFQDDTLEILHVEDSVKGTQNETLNVGRFTPVPWAVGVPHNYTPGNQAVPFEVSFDIDLSRSDGAVRRYFQEQLSAGRLVVIVTTLKETEFMGGGNPTFITRGEPDFDPATNAGRLRLVLTAVPTGDIDGDNRVTLPDYRQFPRCLNGPEQAVPDPGGCLPFFDLDEDDDVDLRDVSGFVDRFIGA
ncbi:MAG: hypothetical protein HY763_15250 [Planctomycetes bacterium]|nr:hypothetical protein [Planctomycetota bacterium]